MSKLPIARAMPKPSPMNKTETRYATVLEARKRMGEVAEYWFEGLTLKLADDTRYTPDFFVLLANGICELHEVKGFMRGDALVKLKVAARLFPFRIVLVRKDRMGFTIEEVTP